MSMMYSRANIAGDGSIPNAFDLTEPKAFWNAYADVCTAGSNVRLKALSHVLSAPVVNVTYPSWQFFVQSFKRM